VECGQTLNVYVEVLNQGKKASGHFRVAFFLDDQEFDSVVLENIPPGEAVTVRGVLDTTRLCGEKYKICYEICVEVDTGDDVRETDE